MNCFLIALRPDSKVGESAIHGTFPDHHILIQEGLWAVAGTQSTCADVCKDLEIGSPEGIGVVVKITEYNGFAERTLWERLNEWERD